MSKKIFEKILSISFAILFAGSAAYATEDTTLWGEAADGTSVGISIEPAGRAEWHPGEIIRIVQSFRARKNAKVPAYGLVLDTELHLITPDGKEFLYGPMKVRERRDATTQRAAAGAWTKWEGEGPYPMELRLSDGKSIWLDAKTNQPAEISLRKPGTYKLFSLLEVQAGETAPKNAWHGKAHSGAATIQVTDLPVEKRLMEMSPEQKQLVNSWVAGREVAEDLRRQIVLTENEGLALRLVDLLKTQKPKRATMTYKIVSQRVGTQQDGDAGIDGPYLKNLAAWVMDVNEGKVTGRDKMSLLGAVQHAVVYLHFHPEDAAMKRRVIEILKQWCRLPREQGITGAKPSQTLAWQAMLQMGVLKDGMTKAQAADLLGNPDDASAQAMQWLVKNSKLENPLVGALVATLDGERITSWATRP